MTTLREAAQQALEALYEADTFHRNLPDQRARRLAAMAALRAALAQQAEPVEPAARECSDPMCACRGGPCAECEEGEREKEIEDLRSSLYFYQRRCEALQSWQSKMRDPERTIVCDILANGKTLDSAVAGDRYTTPPQQTEPVQEPAFHGFMSDDGTQVDVCFSPSAPRSDGTYATAYYTAPPHRVAQQAEPVEPHRREGDNNIESPFNACMHKTYCMTLKQAEPLNLRDPAVQKRLATQWGYVPAAQESVPAAVVGTQSDVWRGYNGQWQAPGEPIKTVQMLRDLPMGTLLYTAPPQRKPLTEEEIDRLWRDPQQGYWDYRKFARAVERKVRGE